MKKAFTLIELLIVVLIIGILAAAALPQYQKAVEKSRATEVIITLKTILNAVEIYVLSNGELPTSLEQLDIDVPENKKYSFSIPQEGSMSTYLHVLAMPKEREYSIAYFKIYSPTAIQNVYNNKALCRAATEEGIKKCAMMGSNKHTYLFNDTVEVFYLN